MRHYQTDTREKAMKAFEESNGKVLSTPDVAGYVYGDRSMTENVYQILSGLERMGIIERAGERGKGKRQYWRLK